MKHACTILLGAGAFALALIGAGCANGTAGPSCSPECVDGIELCCEGAGGGASCVNTISDPRNCGGCGISCPSGVCISGACMGGPGVDGGPPSDGSRPTFDSGPAGSCSPACPSSARCCGSTCISRLGVPTGMDGRSDPSFMSCNGCGISCDAERASACSVPGGGMGTPRCMCGVYNECAAGQICVIDAGAYVCVSTSTDPRNCGMPGNACAVGERCEAGVCQCGTTGAACAAGQACCATGCVDAMTDATNCGACGNVCDAGESCQAGRCVCGSGPTARECAVPMAGMFPAPASLGESCCSGTCVANTTANCGCGVMCEGGDDCIVGGGLPIPGGPMAAPGVCCGMEIPIFGGFCTGGGFPGLGDGGLPFP